MSSQGTSGVATATATAATTAGVSQTTGNAQLKDAMRRIYEGDMNFFNHPAAKQIGISLFIGVFSFTLFYLRYFVFNGKNIVDVEKHKKVLKKKFSSRLKNVAFVKGIMRLEDDEDIADVDEEEVETEIMNKKQHEVAEANLLIRLLQKMSPSWFSPVLMASLDNAMKVWTHLFVINSNSYKSFSFPITLNLFLLRAYYIKKRRASIKDPNTLPGKPIDILDESFFARAAQLLRFSGTVYDSDILRLGVTRRNILIANVTRPVIEGEYNSTLPRFALIIDHLTKSVVLMVRGTSDFFDVVVDLTVEETPLKLKSVDKKVKLVTHKGMLEAAIVILRACKDRIADALSKHKGYNFILTGHSLGGGVAVLAALLIIDEVGDDYASIRKACTGKIECFVFGAPPMFGIPADSSTVEDFKPYEDIHIFIHSADLIPRCSMTSIQRSFEEIEAIDKIQQFTGMDRLQALYSPELPDDVFKAVEEALKNVAQSDDKKIVYSKMIHPNKIFWLVPRVRKEKENEKAQEAQDTTKGPMTANLSVVEYEEQEVVEEEETEEEDEDEAVNEVEIKAKTVQLELKRLDTLAHDDSYQLRDVDSNEFSNEPIYVEDSFAQDHLLTNYELALLQVTGEEHKLE